MNEKDALRSDDLQSGGDGDLAQRVHPCSVGEAPLESHTAASASSVGKHGPQEPSDVTKRYCYPQCRDPFFNECADCWKSGGNPALEAIKKDATSRDGTLTALYHDGEVVTFTDFVFDGDSVDVFRTFEEAEAGRGWARSMRVRRDGDVWWLEEPKP